MVKLRKYPAVDKLHLTNPQRAAVAHLLSGQKNKYKKLLHDAHERLHTIVDFSSNVEVWVSAEGDVEFINSASLQLTGWTPQDFQSRAIALDQLVHQSSLESFINDRGQALQGESPDGSEYRLTARDGSARWVRASWKPVITRLERIIGARISLADITQLKAASARARALESMFKQAVERLDSTAVMTVDSEGGVTLLNSAAARLTGRAVNAKSRDTVSQLFDNAGAAAVMAALREEQKDGKAVRLTVRARKGEAIPCSCVFTVLPAADSSSRVLFCFIHRV
jgi:PAS domain S-box-containing protein